VDTFGENGRYEILSSLGEGGMGSVYLAYDNNLHRKVAIKTLQLTSPINKSQLLKRTDREGKLLSKLRHPSLVPVYEMDMKSSPPYIVQGYVEGCDLANRVESGNLLSVDEAWKIFREQAEVLAYIHSLDLIHRDIKPENIMIDATGKSILMDFGLALDDSVTRMTNDGMFVGTLKYCPPELFTTGISSPSSDVYQLGFVIYELLTGKSYIGAFNNVKEFYDLLFGAAWDRQQMPSEVPLVLGKIITACCRFDEADRIPDGQALLAVINENIPTSNSLDNLSDKKPLIKISSSLSHYLSVKSSRTSMQRKTFKMLHWFGVSLIVLSLTLIFYALYSGSKNGFDSGGITDVSNDYFSTARSWLLYSDGFYLFLPTEAGQDLSWQLESESGSGDPFFAEGIFNRVVGGWQATFKSEDLSCKSLGRSFLLKLTSGGILIAKKNVRFPESSFLEPFTADFSYDKVNLRWKLHGFGKVEVSVKVVEDLPKSNETVFSKNLDAHTLSYTYKYPSQWRDKRLVCTITLPGGRSQSIEGFAGFCDAYQGFLPSEVGEYKRGFASGITINDKLYVTTRLGEISCFSYEASSLNHKFTIDLASQLNYSRNISISAKPLVTGKPSIKRKAEFGSSSTIVVSPADDGIAVWGSGDGRSVVFIKDDGAILVKKIETNLKRLGFDSVNASSKNETLLFFVGHNGKVYMLFHNIANGAIKIFEQPLDKGIPCNVFVVDDVFFCWYFGERNDEIFELSLDHDNLQLHNVGTLLSSPRNRFTRKFAIDGKQKTGLLTAGKELYGLFRKDGLSSFRHIDCKLDRRSDVGGIGSLGGGKFVCVAPVPHSDGLKELGVFKKLNLIYISFGDNSPLPEIRTVRTGTQIADGLNRRCVVNGPYLNNGKFLFSAGMDFHLYDVGSHKQLYFTTFYSTPSRLLLLKDAVFSFQDSHRKISVLNTWD
jgi:serine/threonine protein kinase